MTRTHSQAGAKPRKKTARSAGKTSDAAFPRKALRAFLWTLGLGGGLVLIASLAVCFLPDPDPMIRPVALFLAGLTSLLGGVIAGRIHKSAPALCGLTNGALLLAIMLLCSLFFRKNAAGYSTGTALLLHAAVPLLSVVGAVLGVRKKPKKR